MIPSTLQSFCIGSRVPLPRGGLLGERDGGFVESLAPKLSFSNRPDRLFERFVTQMGPAYARHDIDTLVASGMAIDPAAAHISVGTLLEQVKASIIAMLPDDAPECPPPPRIDKAEP